jgi:hypothetical protein
MTLENPKVKIDMGSDRILVRSGGVLEMEAGATLVDSRGDAGKGFIPLALADAREVSSNATINAAGNGGLLASDTTPILQRVNGATDKALRLNWAASNVDEITWSFAYPPDVDENSALEVHFLAAMAGATDTPTLTVGYFVGVGDTDAGGASAAVTGTTVAEYSVSVAAADVGAPPKVASVSLVPGTHGTDALYLYAAWIEYTRRQK